MAISSFAVMTRAIMAQPTIVSEEPEVVVKNNSMLASRLTRRQMRRYRSYRR